MIKNKLHISTVYVFSNSSNMFGNPVGIIIDTEAQLTSSERLTITRDLGYSETVFIDDIEQPTISIFNPQEEVNFAGHAVLGTYWYFDNELKKDIKSIKCRTSNIACSKDRLHWITSDRNILPSWNIFELNSAEEVESYPNDKANLLVHTLIWAFANTERDLIRARTFAGDWGIPEDEANGSGSMLLALKLNREIKVIHGEGSEIFVKPLSTENISLGGNCTLK